jgi:hypothetical protein
VLDAVLELGRASALDMATDGRRSEGGVSIARGGVLEGGGCWVVWRRNRVG